MERRKKFGKATGEEMNIYTLAWEDYIKWLEKDCSGQYENLKLWLSKSKILKNYKGKKVTPNTPKNKVINDSEILKTA